MRRHQKLVLRLAIALPVFYLFWMVFVGTLAAHELEIGVLATALALAGSIIIELQYPSRFAPRLGQLLTLWRLPWYVVSGTMQITKAAIRDLLGTPAKSLFRVVSFAAGRTNDERAVARRVLAVLYTTATPTSIVLGVNSSDQKLLLHELARGGVSKTLKELGAKA